MSQTLQLQPWSPCDMAWLPRRFLSDELLGTLGTVYENAAELLSEFTQRAADESYGHWLRTQKERPEVEDRLLDVVSRR